MKIFLIILAIIGILWLLAFSFLVYAFANISKCKDKDNDENENKVWSGNPGDLQCFYQKGVTCRYYNSLDMIIERSCKECELYDKKILI